MTKGLVSASIFARISGEPIGFPSRKGCDLRLNQCDRGLQQADRSNSRLVERLVLLKDLYDHLGRLLICSLFLANTCYHHDQNHHSVDILCTTAVKIFP